jgi:hypothetical protein
VLNAGSGELEQGPRGPALREADQEGATLKLLEISDNRRRLAVGYILMSLMCRFAGSPH